MVSWFLLFLGMTLAWAQDPTELVDVRSINPSIIVDLPYATKNNFTKQVLYPKGFDRVFLVRSVAERLDAAAKKLAPQGYRIKIWDGYRPRAVQWKMWKAVPNPKFVGNPSKGSRHNRGAAVDITMTDLNGREVLMPTAYDTFSSRAYAYAILSDREGQVAMRHRKILQEAMRSCGFQIMKTEWWHFDAVSWTSYPLLDIPLEDLNRKIPRRAEPIRARPLKLFKKNAP